MKQITLPAVNLDIQQLGPDQRALVITEMGPAGPGDVYVIPMPNNIAEDVGRKLSSPSVQVAPASALIRP